MTIHAAWRALLVAALSALSFAGRAEGIDAVVEPQAAAREVLVMLRLPPPHFRPDGAYAGGYSSRSGSADRQRIAEDLAVRFKLRIKGSWPMPALGVDCFVMEAPETLPLEPLIERMSQDTRVESVLM